MMIPGRVLLLLSVGFASALSVSGAGAAGPTEDRGAPTDSIGLLIEAAGDSARWPGQGTVAVFDRTEVEVEASGLGHVRRHWLLKILSEEGAAGSSTLRLDYDPASNFIRIDSLKVRRAGGGWDRIDAHAARDLPAPADLIYWGARMKLVSLPRLDVGDAIEVWTYKKGFQIAYLTGSREDEERYIPPMRGHFYDVVLFQESHPIIEKTYRLRVPRDKPVQFAVYNGALRSSLVFSGDALVYTWQARDVDAYEPESREPDPTDVMPKVVLATVESWAEKSRWFQEVNEPVFDADEAIRAKVREIIAPCRDDDERMAALLHWVAQEIRYSGLSMGKGEGYTLHPGIMSYEDRCGVCKDIAGMLVTMLRAAGFTTYPVMTMAGSRVEAIPADQFNHCVVAVERADGSFTMLDPTWAPFDRATWSRMEGEQHYVIGSPRGEGLSRMRTFTPEESRMSIRSEARIDETGDLTGVLRLTGIGASDSRLRGFFGETPISTRSAVAASLLRGLGAGAAIVDLEFRDPRDFSSDMEIELHYRVDGYAAANDSVIAFLLPGARILASTPRICRAMVFGEGVGDGSDRKHDALVWFSQQVELHEDLSLPKGFEAIGGTATLRHDEKAASVSADLSGDGSHLRTVVEVVNKKRTIPAAEWKGGVAVADSLKEFAGRLRWARRSR
jgi:transglutaminase-like putative cysteine protease